MWAASAWSNARRLIMGWSLARIRIPVKRSFRGVAALSAGVVVADVRRMVRGRIADGMATGEIDDHADASPARRGLDASDADDG